MREIYFKKLTIISGIQKAARQFEFSKNYNLILSVEKNSVGKSTLVKNIFWSFGCDTRFDDYWKELDAKTILEFEVENINYQISRHGNKYTFKKEGEKENIFTKITGELAQELSKIFNFNALLLSRESAKLVTPPPAYFFLPFYVDQKQGWANTWNGFANLGQFSRWSESIIPYHVGIYTKDYFIRSEEINNKKKEKEELTSEVESISNALSLINKISTEDKTSLDTDEIDKFESELESDYASLKIRKEIITEELTTLKSEETYLASQLVISEISLKEVEKDYEYSEELPDNIECPICGTKHDNSISNRFTLYQDKEQLIQIIKRLELQKTEAINKITKKKITLKEIKSEISSFEEKYSTENIDNSSIFKSIATRSINSTVKNTIKEKKFKIHSISEIEKELKKDRTKENAKRKKDVESKFQELFPKYINKLRAYGVNTTLINSPTKCKKVADSGGAAESTRAMLAYYVAVYNLIYEFGEQKVSPLIIDTPNQQEQASNHYDTIMNLLLTELPKKSQVFICGMDSEKLKKAKSVAKIIQLDEERSLLKTDKFEELNSKYSYIFEL